MEGYVVDEQILTPTQTTPIPLQFFFFYVFNFFCGGWGWVYKIRKDPTPTRSPTYPWPSSTFFLKGGGVNLKNRLTDQIPTPTLRNSIPPYFRGVGTVLCYSSSPRLEPLASFSAFYLYTVLTRPSHHRSRPSKVQCVKHAAPCHSSGDQLMI